jgi:hypothetical protein
MNIGFYIGNKDFITLSCCMEVLIAIMLWEDLNQNQSL